MRKVLRAIAAWWEYWDPFGAFLDFLLDHIWARALFMILVSIAGYCASMYLLLGLIAAGCIPSPWQ